mgnify:CR=1 FL=1
MVVLRAGLYERVSTDEQAKYGFSIKTILIGDNIKKINYKDELILDGEIITF